jgi:hypothetical protein
MAGQDFKSILQSWVGSQVTVINPESFKATALGQGLGFQSYTAQIVSLGEDYIKLAYSAIKKDSQTEVEQIIPISLVKRITIWGSERLLHL